MPNSYDDVSGMFSGVHGHLCPRGEEWGEEAYLAGGDWLMAKAVASERFLAPILL